MPIFRRAFRPVHLLWLALPLVTAAALVRGNPPAQTASSAPPPRSFAEPHPDLPARLAELGIDHWHADGLTGRGVKIAVLDSGFRGYREFLGGALPGRVRARSFRSDGDLEARDSQHGILCAEVIHAIAPDAELLLANWQPDDPPSFLDALKWTREQGARVISCSVVMPGWSDGEGGGSVHRNMARILGEGDSPGDPIFVASAGNLALRHWAGDSRRSAPGGWIEWSPGCVENPLTPWGDRPVSVEWSSREGDPSEYEVVVADARDGVRVGEPLPLPAEGFPGGALRFDPRAGHRYVLKLRLRHGPGGPVRMVVLGASIRHYAPRGSVAFPGDGPDVVAVGAVYQDGSRPAYSSCGPNASVIKPEVVAPVPFPSRWREEPFTGTSASAPQVAALAALWLQRHPDWSRGRVRAALCEHSRDLTRFGRDYETGFGMARLPNPTER